MAATAAPTDASIVRIREYKKDHVDFVLENVDLAYVSSLLGDCALMNLAVASRTPFEE